MKWLQPATEVISTDGYAH